MPVPMPYLFIIALLLLTGNNPVAPKVVAQDSYILRQEQISKGPEAPFPYQKKQVISYTATLYSASMISMDLRGLAGSDPGKSGYYVAIWQGRQIQDLSRSLDVQLINLNTQDGSFVFQLREGINDKDYIIGLGINKSDSTSFCSTLIIPKGQERYIPISDSNAFSSSVSIVQIGTNSLIAAYKTPDFNLPEINKNWIALFRGPFTANTYKGINLIRKQNVAGNLNEAMIAFNDIDGGLAPNQSYTLVYGMGYPAADSNSTASIIAATEFLVPGN